MSMSCRARPQGLPCRQSRPQPHESGQLATAGCLRGLPFRGKRRLALEEWMTDRCPSKNPSFTPPFGPVAMNSAATWMPASKRITSWCCSPSSTSVTSTPACLMPITIPAGASFKDMITLKGEPDVGDQINKKILAPLAKANKLPDMPDFNDATKLGSGEEMVDRLTNLVAIFENPALDFSKNRAEVALKSIPKSGGLNDELRSEICCYRQFAARDSL